MGNVRNVLTSIALGRRQSKRDALWVMTEEIARPPSHRFCAKVNEVLKECRFDRTVERLCESFYMPVEAGRTLRGACISGRC